MAQITWTSCTRRERKTAHGILPCVARQPFAVIWRCCIGHDIKGFLGTKARALWPPGQGVLTYCSGLEQKAARGTVGCERKLVRGVMKRWLLGQAKTAVLSRCELLLARVAGTCSGSRGAVVSTSRVEMPATRAGVIGGIAVTTPR